MRNVSRENREGNVTNLAESVANRIYYIIRTTSGFLHI
jgi:hypothetical protein